jgi:ABC-2 type transport system permease protein
VLFALAGFVNAVYAKKFDDISIIPTFILTPLTYLGGVFYSVACCRRSGATCRSPTRSCYTVNAFRYGVLGESDVSVGVAFAIMLAMILVLGAFCLRLLDKGVGLRA